MTQTIHNSIEVGQELPVLQLSPVDRSMLALFAGSSGDHNPVHIDTDFARKAGYPEVFAQGMLGMAWLARLLTDWVPQARIRQFNVRFMGVTHLGNAICCSGRVTKKESVNGEACARVEVAATNQYGQVKIVGEAVVALSESN